MGDGATNVIECVFAADDGYSQHLAVVILSLADNNRNNDVNVTVISRGISDKNQQLLKDMMAPYRRFSLKFISLDPALVAHLPTRGHLTVETYFRLFIPEIFPETVERALYLDADMAIVDDLMPLWRTDMGDYPIAAAPDTLDDNSNARLSLPADNVPFNAGVLLINMPVWRRENLRATCVDWAMNHEEVLRHCDQDALNAVLIDRVKYVSVKWNLQAPTTVEILKSLGLSEAEALAVLRKPSIVHYSTMRKPWRYKDRANYEGIYMRYLRRTPWRKVGQPDWTFDEMMKRNLGHRLGPTVRGLLNRLAGRTPGGAS